MLDPPLKWAGGKRWLVRSHAWLFPSSFSTYVEPFVGGGAVFFRLQPAAAVLADKNEWLIRTYAAIRDDTDAVVQALAHFAQRHSDRFYYELRGKRQEHPAWEAARLLYLNRTCWNGLFRVNLKGQFNVPRGTKNAVLLPTDDFYAVASVLRNSELLWGDFSVALKRAGRGDFVFVDPPYTVAHNNNGFLKYNEDIFSWDDQVRLRDAVVEAVSRGAKVLVLNANHQSVRELYDGLGQPHVVSRHSVISGKADFRRGVEEFAIQLGFATAPQVRRLASEGELLTGPPPTTSQPAE